MSMNIKQRPSSMHSINRGQAREAARAPAAGPVPAQSEVARERATDAFVKPPVSREPLVKTGEPAKVEPKKQGFWGRLGGALMNAGIRVANNIVGNVWNRLGGTVGPNSPLPSTMRGYGEFSDKQKGLLEPGGQKTYDALPSRNKAAFIVLTTQMDKLGIDYSGMRLKPGGGQIDRLMLEEASPGGMARLRASMEAGIKNGTFDADRPHEDLHPGQADAGARQAVGRESMQIGLGPDGAFVDIDRHNVLRGGTLGHIGEVLMPGQTDMGQVARALGIPLGATLTKG